MVNAVEKVKGRLGRIMFTDKTQDGMGSQVCVYKNCAQNFM